MTCPIPVKIAKFRGVEFHHESGSQSGGRRIVVHEYPFREEHYTEDLGRKARTWTVSGYLLQPDVRDKMRRLRNAFEQFGAGPLYHAWANKTIIARVQDYSFDDTRDDLTRINFSATFVERGDTASPTILRGLFGQLFGILDSFNEALTSAYSTVLGVVDDAQALADGFTAATGYFTFQQRRSGGYASAASARAGGPITGFIGDVSAANGTVKRQEDFLANMAAMQVTGGASAQVSAVAYAGAALSEYAAILFSADFEGRVDGRDAVRRFVSAARQYQALAESLGLIDLARQVQVMAAQAGVVSINAVPPMASWEGSAPALVAAYEIYGGIDRASDLIGWNNGVAGARLIGPLRYVSDLQP